MDVNNFKQKYYEQIIFDEMKDEPFDTMGFIRKKYANYDVDYGVDYRNVYKRIMDYRIKKYGTSYIPTSVNKRKRDNRNG